MKKEVFFPVYLKSLNFIWKSKILVYTKVHKSTFFYELLVYVKIINDLNTFVEQKFMISQQRLTPRTTDLFHGLFMQSDKIIHKYIPLPYISWVGSGREALRQILLQIKGKKVGVPAFTCHVVLDAVRRAGKEPIFYDCGVIAKIDDISKILPKVEALILGYNFGFLADLGEISALCKKEGVILIEDCAQALGATRSGKQAGSFGDYAFYSFGISKNIGYCGGLIASKKPLKRIRVEKYPFGKLLVISVKSVVSRFFFNPFIYGYVRRLLQGELTKEHPSLSYGLPVFARRVVLHQFKRYNCIFKIRRKNAQYCMDHLCGIVDFIEPTFGSSWLYFTILVEKRGGFLDELLKRGVELGEMKTFYSLDGISPKSLEAEGKHVTFALYRNSQDIKRIVCAIKEIQLKKR